MQTPFVRQNTPHPKDLKAKAHKLFSANQATQAAQVALAAEAAEAVQAVQAALAPAAPPAVSDSHEKELAKMAEPEEDSEDYGEKVFNIGKLQFDQKTVSHFLCNYLPSLLVSLYKCSLHKL